MSPRLAGPLLVPLAAGAALSPDLRLAIVPATVLWLLCLRRRGEATAAAVLVVAALLRLPFVLSDHHSDDLYRYLWEGRVHLAGFSPYAHAPDDPALAHLRDGTHSRINHPEMPTVYPPLAQMLFRGAAWAGLGGAGLRNVILVLDFATVVVLLGWLRATGRPPGRAIAYAWCPVAVCAAATGHCDPLMLLLLVGSGWAFESRRFAAAAALLGGAVLAKTVAVLVLPWLVLRRPREAFLVAIPVVLLGYLPFADGPLAGSLVAFGSDFAFNASVFRVFEWLSPAAARPIVALLLGLWVLWVALTEPRYADAAALALALLLVLSPTVHYWYLTWFLVLVPAVGPRAWTRPLLLWAATVLFALETYRARHDGGPFEERFLLTWLEYAPLALLGLWLLARSRAAREPLAAAADAVAPRFSVVIPCRGEAESLRVLLPRWTAAGAERVVVADTPTGDGTEALVRATPGCAYLPVRERGYGAAVHAGLEAAADGFPVVVCDADHLRGPGQAGALLAPFADPAVGLVAAARSGARLPLAQRAGNGLVLGLVALGWGRRFHDLGPFRALRPALWPRGALADRGFGWNVEMNVRALELGMKVVEVPLEASERQHGENRISGTLSGVVRAGAGILTRLWRLREESCARPS